jgi:UDP-2,3-diacylglucosamine pyrophosphatase LpxH
MTTYGHEICLPSPLRREPSSPVWSLPSHARWRLSSAQKAAVEVPFDYSSRIVLFSDLHRGDGSRADAFAANAQLFYCALKHYYGHRFTYIEVGDGDELWKNWTSRDVVRAYEQIFDLMHRFDREGRQHLILGNHDLPGRRQSATEKAGMQVRESLTLRHTRTGQRLLVLHGHQADLKSDSLALLSRFFVASVWKRLQLAGLAALTYPAGDVHHLKRIERVISAWAREQGQIVVCGHTHRPMSAAYGAVPYFNAGSCVFPGYITGLEIQNGEISLVRWRGAPKSDVRGRQVMRIERQLVAAPRKLGMLGC